MYVCVCESSCVCVVKKYVMGECVCMYERMKTEFVSINEGKLFVCM